MLKVLAGDHSFLRAERLAELVAEFGLQPERLEIDNLTAKQWQLELSKQDLFTPKRLVIVQNLSKNADLRDQTVELLDELLADENLLLIADEAEFDARTKFAKVVKKAGVVEQFTLPKGYDESAAIEFILKQAEKSELKLGRSEAKLIWQRVGADPWAQVDGLRKLASLGGVVTAEKIATYVDQKTDAAVFELVNYIWQGEVAELQKNLNLLRQADEAPQRLLGLISSQVVNLATVKAAGSLSQAQADLGLHPFAAKNLWAEAQRLTWTQVKLVIDRLNEIDAQTKSSKVDPWELLIIGLTQTALELHQKIS